jgi:hypothetical protein
MKIKSDNSVYTGEYLARVAFPLGGTGAGMICLEGTGTLSHVSLRGYPDVFNEPLMFSALWLKGEPDVARMLEGPVPTWKIMFPWGEKYGGAGGGGEKKITACPIARMPNFKPDFPLATSNWPIPKFLWTWR